MNDRMKFWDPVKKEMIKSLDGYYVKMNSVDDCEGENDEFEFVAWCFPKDIDPYELKKLQCIGRSDKNCRMIYEGDIVKVYFQMNPGDEVVETIVLIEDIRNLPRLGGSSRECEVIGTEFENPELLTKSQL